MTFLCIMFVVVLLCVEILDIYFSDVLPLREFPFKSFAVIVINTSDSFRSLTTECGFQPSSTLKRLTINHRFQPLVKKLSGLLSHSMYSIDDFMQVSSDFIFKK